MTAPSFSAVQAMRNASVLLQAGNFAQARVVLEAVLRSEPRLTEAHRLLAGALQALGDRIGAERALRTAVAIDPGWAPAQVSLGELLTEDGRIEEAEQVLRWAVSAGDNYPRAALSLGRLLLLQHRAQEAHDLLFAHATAASPSAELLNEYASALNALERYDEAAVVFARLVQSLPQNGVIEARLAAAQASAGHYAAAAQSAQRALKKGADLAPTWFVVGHAAIGEDRYDDAEAAFRAACARAPEYADAQRELAQLIWMRTGDLAAASAQLDTRLREQPQAPALLTVKANLLQSAGDDIGAVALLAEAAARPDADAGLLLTASEAALKVNSPDALAFAERALRQLPGNPAAARRLGDALLNAGRAAEAEVLAHAELQRHPEDQGLIALLASALRLRGDESYRQIHDYAGLVHAWTIDTPPQWPDLPSYLADLAASLRRMHGLQTHPVHQSLRHGTQTTRNLMESDDAAISAFFGAIDGPIRQHMQTIGHGADPTRRRNTGRYRIRGIWSVQLQPNGYHTNHVHPEGWLSSACYIDLPPAIDDGRQGWLKFGEPGILTQPPLGPEYYVRPEPGLLALFPSHMWHGTVPFAGPGTRLTIAFDAVPV